MVGAVLGYFTSSGNAVNVNQGSFIASSAIENNRQLHPAEMQALREKSLELAGVDGLTEEDWLRRLSRQAMRSVDAQWAEEFADDDVAQEYLYDLMDKYGEAFVNSVGGQLIFLVGGQYYDTSVPYSQYLAGGNQGFAYGEVIPGRVVNRNSDPDFYNVVLDGWDPANSRLPMRGFSSVGDMALYYSLVDELPTYGPNDRNNVLNNPALYDPANPDIDIIDLDAQAYVAWEFNNNRYMPYTGVTATSDYDEIWHYQRNYFNGEAPELAYFNEIFGDDLASLTAEGAVSGEGWTLIEQPLAVYHCGDNGETCFKFANTATGQEFVYLNGEAVFDAGILGTYNYALDPTAEFDNGWSNIFSYDEGHLADDVLDYWTDGNVANDPTPWYDRIVGGDGLPTGVLAPPLPVNPEKMLESEE